MIAPVPTLFGWTRRRWIWILAGGVAAHLALVCWLGERAKPVGVVAAPEAWLKLAADPASIRRVVDSPLRGDPTLFALPSLRGFSGGAWLTFSPGPPARFEWTEPPRWLPLDTNELGSALKRPTVTNKYAGSIMSEVLRPRLTAADILVLNDTLMTQSVVSVEGPLSGRALATPIRLADPAHNDLLTNTVVQVRVGPDGLSESVMLIEGCGVKSVDEQAVAIARAARFEPVSSTPPAGQAGPVPAWGRLIFHWYTLPRAN